MAFVQFPKYRLQAEIARNYQDLGDNKREINLKIKYKFTDISRCFPMFVHFFVLFHINDN